MSADLELVAKRAATWSETADHLKTRLDLVRWIVFALSIAGAFTAAIASQILPEAGAATSALPRSHTLFATLGAVLLAGATFLSGRLLRDTETQAWVRARAAAEALKREAFKSATKAQPYDTSTADELLKKEREKIEGQLTDLRDRQVEATREGSAPRGALSPEQYRERRVRPQIDWYASKAHRYRKIATRLRWTEFTLALAATIITALAGALGKKIEIGPMAFDFAALYRRAHHGQRSHPGAYRGIAVSAPGNELLGGSGAAGGPRHRLRCRADQRGHVVRVRKWLRGGHRGREQFLGRQVDQGDDQLIALP